MSRREFFKKILRIIKKAATKTKKNIKAMLKKDDDNQL